MNNRCAEDAPRAFLDDDSDAMIADFSQELDLQNLQGIRGRYQRMVANQVNNLRTQFESPGSDLRTPDLDYTYATSESPAESLVSPCTPDQPQARRRLFCSSSRPRRLQQPNVSRPCSPAHFYDPPATPRDARNNSTHGRQAQCPEMQAQCPEMPSPCSDARIISISSGSDRSAINRTAPNPCASPCEAITISSCGDPVEPITISSNDSRDGRVDGTPTNYRTFAQGINSTLGSSVDCAMDSSNNRPCGGGNDFRPATPAGRRVQAAACSTMISDHNTTTTTYPNTTRTTNPTTSSCLQSTNTTNTTQSTHSTNNTSTSLNSTRGIPNCLMPIIEPSGLSITIWLIILLIALVFSYVGSMLAYQVCRRAGYCGCTRDATVKYVPF